MDDGAQIYTDVTTTFANDLACLSNSALRQKYRREANSHAAIKRRCRDGSFELDPAWNLFKDFLRDMGPRPIDDATIDRLDPEVRRYGPGLCRWATKVEQTINRSNTRWVNFQGERIRLQEFADRIGANYTTVHGALGRGESPDFIAHRIGISQLKPSAYQPAWIADCEKLNRWRTEYEIWRRKVRRDRRDLAYPEVYAAILASESFHEAKAFLEHKGLSEMTSDEHQIAQEKWPTHFRCFNEGINWINHALRALHEKDLPLTLRLLPNGSRWEDIRLFEHFLIPLPDR